MKYKFKTTKQKSAEMSRVHSTGGKDEVILRKISIRLQFSLMENFGMDMSGRNISQGLNVIVNIGFTKLNIISNTTKK